MKAIGKFIVINETKESVKKTEGGLELTDRHTDDIRYIKGKVISPGTDVIGVGENDNILFDRRAGHGIEIEGKFYKVIQERDVVMIL